MTPAPAPAPAPNPYIAGAGMAMQGLGTIASIYGAYKAQELAEKQAEDEKKFRERQMQFQQQQFDAGQRQQALNNESNAGSYAQNYQDRIAKNYGNYYAQNRI